MVFDGPVFWMPMGILAVVVGGALWSFADRHGWAMTWWKWFLFALWYALFGRTFYAAGTLMGEFEPRAGWRVLLLGLFFTVVCGVGLVRVLAHRPRSADPESSETQEP